MIENQQVAEMQIVEPNIYAKLTDGTQIEVSTPGYTVLYLSVGDEIDRQVAAGTLKIDTPEPVSPPWWLSMLPSLGRVGPSEEYNEILDAYTVQYHDNSFQILLYGVLTVLSGKVFGVPGVRPSFALAVVAGMSLVLLYGWNRRKLLMIVLGSVGLAVGGVVLLSGLWDFLGKIPWLGIGIPAITGFYFDWFSGAIQAFIFCTLTTIFIKQAAQG